MTPYAATQARPQGGAETWRHSLTPSQARQMELPEMHKQARYALDHPVFDPERQIITGHYWLERADAVSACLTVNIGME